MDSVEFGGILYRDESRATAAFLDWYLGTRVAPTETTDTVFEQLMRDIADRQVERYDWLTDDLIRAELPAALKQAQFDDERSID